MLWSPTRLLSNWSRVRAKCYLVFPPGLSIEESGFEPGTRLMAIGAIPITWDLKHNWQNVSVLFDTLRAGVISSDVFV